MIARRPLTCLLALLALSFAASTAGAEAAPLPAWELAVTPLPANFAPGAKGEFLVEATNVGAAATSGPTLLEVELPPELSFSAAASAENSTPLHSAFPCAHSGSALSCEIAGPVGSGRHISLQVQFTVPADAGGTATLSATVSGGGAQTRSASAGAPLQAEVVPFGFLAPGLQAPLTEADGTPSSLAGSHPYQQTVSFATPTRAILEGRQTTNSGHPRDILLELPPGLTGNPTATPVLCTEVELQFGECPAASQIGILQITTAFVQAGHLGFAGEPLYDMVPPPGSPAELASNVGGAGIYSHLLASVRSDGDYGIDVTTPDVIALPAQPIFGIKAQVWGDPGDPGHEGIRGACFSQGGSCPAEPAKAAFWTLPGRCGPDPIETRVRSDSWEEPGLFRESTYQSADLQGNPVSISGCNQLEFAPTITARPTTSLADSPSGLDVDLHQPQHTEFGHRSSPPLKEARVTLPAGMAVNPSQADGLGACATAQIGLMTEVGATPVHFDKTPNSCPDAAKLGTVEVTTPLLARREDGGAKLVTDPETGEPLLEPLHGSVYLAKPFQNPFNSLLAIYLAVEDPRSGTVAKLAGRVEPDPATGQITTVFAENPQLPLEDVRLHLFPGARASLITPLDCATHTTSTDLVPWSSPEGADAHPTDSFQTTASPAGACPSSPEAAADAPAFDAGTLGRAAGSFSPFTLKLSREDGTQRLTGLDTTLPPGLSGKLAGIAECSEAQIAAAQARSHPEEGIAERRSPSCPAASEVGSVVVGAGAGPTPYYAGGHAYLAGPYKGAPLSLAIITPAIAGPFDLGTVVVRTALYVDPETAQIHAVSDPFPTILDGIPLDLRSVALRMDRPDFTLNPTSCDPMAITGSATSALGQAAPLTTPFQVGGCSALKFKPRLSLKLKGGTRRNRYPSLTATLKMAPGGANIGSAQVTLPHSAFLEQSHIRETCSHPALLSDSCPASSVYGHAVAISPLLDQPLEGPVYLATGFGYTLPALVADLNGQIEVLLHGRVDTGRADGIRNTFQVVPDAPVSRFTLHMFGGRRGLIVNSENLCGPHARRKALARFVGQNGKVTVLEPTVQNSCRGGGGKKKGHGHRKGEGGHKGKARSRGR